jgi:predicted ester cyclase
MSQTPDGLARQWFDEVWNKGDESAIDRLMAADGISHGLAPEPIRGPEQFKPFYRMFKSALGDLSIAVERTVVEGDTCAVLCHVVARHVGHTLGGAATNRDVDFWGMTMVRVKDGKLVEGWNAFDFLAMYQQMGWVGSPVVPADAPSV